MACKQHESDEDDCDACEKSADLATYSATIYSRDARIAELEVALDEEIARTDALVAALPKCDYHKDRPATKAWKRGDRRYCDECNPNSIGQVAPDYPRAAPLRAILAARGKR